MSVWRFYQVHLISSQFSIYLWLANHYLVDLTGIPDQVYLSGLPVSGWP
jgi:hypothetical protein